MPDQGLSSLLTGLANGISGYMGKQQNLSNQEELNQQNSDLTSQRMDQQADLQLDNEQQLALYKQTIAGKVDPKTAAILSPNGADIVNNFQQNHGRMPTIDEFKGLLDTQSDNSKAQVAQQKSIQSALQTAQKGYNTDYKKESDALMASETAGDQVKLALNNPIAYSSVPVTLARMMTGTSRINQQEIQRLGGSQAILDKANQIGTQMTKGTITPDNASWMSDLVNVLKTSHQQNIEDIGVHHASQYRQISGEDLPTAYQKVTGSQMPDRFNHPLGNPNVDQTKITKNALRVKLGLPPQ